MSEHRERLSRMRNRRQSVRLAQAATQKAVSELSPSQRAQSGTSPRPILRQTKDFVALSTRPNITFATTPKGRLGSGLRGVQGTARHEVAHHLGAGHTAFRAATGGMGGLSARQVQTSLRLQGQSLERRVQRTTVLQSRGRRSNVPGFQTPHLAKVAKTGTSAQQGRSREQMRRLGRRLRGRIDF